MAERQKRIAAFDVPPLEGLTDAEIEAIAAQLADEIAEDLAPEPEEEPAREPEEALRPEAAE